MKRLKAHTFFPEIDWSVWEKLPLFLRRGREKSYAHDYETYHRNDK